MTSLLQLDKLTLCQLKQTKDSQALGVRAKATVQVQVVYGFKLTAAHKNGRRGW